MKALTERLEWVRLYLVDPSLPQTESFKRDILDVLLGAMAIAEALPEISITVPGGAELAPTRRLPPERIIEV